MPSERKTSVPRPKFRPVRITESFGESREFANASIELRELGIEMSEAVRVYKMYGSDSVRIVKENPYTLAEDIRGINFNKADEIAARLGIDPDSSVRIESGIRYMLKAWAASGSTLVPERLLIEKTAGFLDVMMDDVRDSLKDMVFAGELEEDSIGGVAVIYLYGYYHAEQRVAHALMRIRDAAAKAVPMQSGTFLHAARENALRLSNGEVELSTEQQRAIEACLANNVTIITGGPGTGKTTIINTLVKIFDFAAYVADFKEKQLERGKFGRSLYTEDGNPTSICNTFLALYLYDCVIKEMK